MPPPCVSSAFAVDLFQIPFEPTEPPSVSMNSEENNLTLPQLSFFPSFGSNHVHERLISNHELRTMNERTPKSLRPHSSMYALLALQ